MYTSRGSTRVEVTRVEVTRVEVLLHAWKGTCVEQNMHRMHSHVKTYFLLVDLAQCHIDSSVGHI